MAFEIAILMRERPACRCVRSDVAAQRSGEAGECNGAGLCRAFCTSLSFLRFCLAAVLFA